MTTHLDAIAAMTRTATHTSQTRTADWSPGTLENLVGLVGVSLARWSGRDPDRAQPEVRRAATAALNGIDAAIHELHELRSALVTEIHRDDDATALAALRGEEES